MCAGGRRMIRRMGRAGFRRAWIRAVSVIAVRNYAMPVVTALLAAAFYLYCQFDLPVGPVDVVVGVIESSGGGLADGFGTTTIMATVRLGDGSRIQRSEEHTSELQSLMRI